MFDSGLSCYSDGSTDFNKILTYADEMRDVGRHQVSEIARPLTEKSRVLRKMYNEIEPLFG